MTLCLKQADIGVAMGMGGTEVAKEASVALLMETGFQVRGGDFYVWG